MKKTMLLLATLTSIALAADPNYPPPSYYQSSNVQGIQGNAFYTQGPGYVIEPLSGISCDCLNVTWEWDGKTWLKSPENFSISDPGQYADGYEIGVDPISGLPKLCSVQVLVQEKTYTAAIIPPPLGVLFDQGIGSKWAADWAFQNIPFHRADQWEQYCDGAGPEEINPNLDAAPC